MNDRLTHASFFSGVGGLDMGLERADWRTVSFSEIDPYASAVLAERWPGFPNLGCIKTVAGWLAEHRHDVKLHCVTDPGGWCTECKRVTAPPVHDAADEQRQGLRDTGDGGGEPSDAGGRPAAGESVGRRDPAGAVHDVGVRPDGGAGLRTPSDPEPAHESGDGAGHRVGTGRAGADIDPAAPSHQSQEADPRADRLGGHGLSGQRVVNREGGVGRGDLASGDVGHPATPRGATGSAGGAAAHAGQPAAALQGVSRHQVEHGQAAGVGTEEASDWRTATLWTGGFPCQDLSIAGKRRGLQGGDTRSGLAFAFLDLVERYRPAVILLENVPGLLSSHAGRDLGALTRRMAELGYGWAFRVLDARYFGVPQRRRRVFILGIHTRLDPTERRAAEILSVGARCQRHPATGHQTGPRAPDGSDAGVVGTFTAGAHPGSYNGQDATTGHLAGAITRRYGKGVNTTVDDGAVVIGSVRATGKHDHVGDERRLVVGAGGAVGADATDGGKRAGDQPGQPRPEHVGDGGRVTRLNGAPPDADRDGAPDGLAGRSHDRDGLADTLRVGGRASGAGDSYDNTPWVADTLNSGGNDGGFRTEPGAHLAIGGSVKPDSLLPLGLDSHRYRCCGNGVVADVAEWIGARLAATLPEPGDSNGE